MNKRELLNSKFGVGNRLEVLKTLCPSLIPEFSFSCHNVKIATSLNCSFFLLHQLSILICIASYKHSNIYFRLNTIGLKEWLIIKSVHILLLSASSLTRLVQLVPNIMTVRLD